MSEVSKKKRSFKPNLTMFIILATVLGIIVGTLVGPKIGNFKFIGDMFIRLIQMSIVLLVMTSVAAAVGNVGGKGLGRMSVYTFGWIILFTVVSAFMGLFLADIIKPGVGVKIPVADFTLVVPEAVSIQSTILDFVPTNIISSMATSSMVPCIVFALIFGLAMGMHTKATGNTLIPDMTKNLNSVIMNIIQMVMYMAPVGIFFLLANVAGSMGLEIIKPMLKFLLVLFVGDLLQLLIYIPITCAICKVNPLKMPKKLLKMSIIALTTTSSAITLPTKMEDSVEKFGISKKVTEFTGPITMSMNSSGAVLCYVAAILFIAQSFGIELTTHQLVMSIVLSCLMCLGTIVVPGGAIIVYTFLASSIGLPLDSVALLIAIDWFSGMFRTLTNVDIDVLIGMLVSSHLGDFDRDVYNGLKEVKYDS